MSESEISNRKQLYAQKCVVRSCLNTTTNCKKRFFSFPEDLCWARLWAVKCNRKDLLKRQHFKYFKVCADHIADDMYSDFEKTQLKSSAIPSVSETSDMNLEKQKVQDTIFDLMSLEKKSQESVQNMPQDNKIGLITLETKNKNSCTARREVLFVPVFEITELWENTKTMRLNMAEETKGTLKNVKETSGNTNKTTVNNNKIPENTHKIPENTHKTPVTTDYTQAILGNIKSYKNTKGVAQNTKEISENLYKTLGNTQVLWGYTEDVLDNTKQVCENTNDISENTNQTLANTNEMSGNANQYESTKGTSKNTLEFTNTNENVPPTPVEQSSLSAQFVMEKMSHRKCSVFGCPRQRMAQSFYTFPSPAKSPSRFCYWIKATGNPVFKTLDVHEIHKQCRKICRRHFKESDFCVPGKMRHDAVPSLHLPPPIDYPMMEFEEEEY